VRSSGFSFFWISGLALIDGSPEHRYRGKDYCNYYFVDALSTEKGNLIILQTSLV
jgi:hypothetical protein